MTKSSNIASSIILHNIERNADKNREYLNFFMNRYKAKHNIAHLNVIEYSDKIPPNREEMHELNERLIDNKEKAIVVLGSYLKPKEFAYYGYASFFTAFKDYYDIYCVDFEGHLYRRVSCLG